MTRGRLTLLLAALAATSMLVVALLVVTERIGPAGPIPGSPPDNSTTSSQGADVGTVGSFGLITLVNHGGRPAVIDQVRLLDKDPKLEIVGTYLAGLDRPDNIGAADGFPPLKAMDGVPVKGAVVPPKGTPRWDWGVELIVGARALAPGRQAFSGVEVRYHVGWLHHRVVINDGYELCAPLADYIAGRVCAYGWRP